MSAFFRLTVLAVAIAALTAVSASAAPENAGPDKATTKVPFQTQTVARFDLPWAIAIIDADRLIVTTKPGEMFLVNRQGGDPIKLSGVPKVEHAGQNGLLDVALAPDFAQSRRIYFTYVEPGEGGSSLALARATLAEQQGAARLDGFEIIWRQMPKGKGGQPGGIIAFAPDGKSLFLTSGDRMRPETAQNPDLALGKVLHLTLDGKPAPGNPAIDAGGCPRRDMDHGASQPLWPCLCPRWSPLAARDGAEGGRRTQPDRAGCQLRLAGGLLRRQLQWHADPQAADPARNSGSRRFTGIR